MNLNLCDYSYDERLMENEFLKSHDYYLPYVGVNYRDAKVKVLHIGNCPYIESDLDVNKEFGCDFFIKNWFKNPDELNNKVPKEWISYCLNTRAVVEEYLTAERNRDNKVGTMSYKIYSFITKMLSNSIVAEKNIGYKKLIGSINMPKDNSAKYKTKDKQEEKRNQYLAKLKEYKANTKIYNYVAFTDFHMFPSLIRGEANVLDSLIEVNSKEKIQNNVHDFYKEVIDKSCETLKHMIEVLQPDVILVTSGPVKRIFPITKFDNRVIKMNHPNSLRGQNTIDNYIKEFNEKAEAIINN